MSATDIELENLAVRLLIAAMRSASTDRISPKNWWTRARSAIETAAKVSSSWSHLISRLAAKLEIEAYQEASSKEICSIGQAVNAAGFEEFRAFCEDRAVYIAAMAQVARAEQREEFEEKVKARRVYAKAGVGEEEVF